MAQTVRYYSGLSDPQITKDILFRSFDGYISLYEYEGTGVYSAAAGTGKFTPATSPTWVVDTYKSTQKKNLFFIDDNGKLAYVKTLSNTANDISFTIANALLFSDGVTAPALTATNTYTLYVLTPSNDNVYGNYMGYTKLKEFNPGIEVVSLLTKNPEIQVRTDISGVKPILKGEFQNIGTPHLQYVDQLATFGSQVGQTALYTGSGIQVSQFWEIYLVGKNVQNKLQYIHAWRSNVLPDGAFNLGEKNYKVLGFDAKLVINPYVETDLGNLWGIANAT